MGLDISGKGSEGWDAKCSGVICGAARNDSANFTGPLQYNYHVGVLVGERRRKLLSYDSSYWDSSQHRVIWCEAICTAVERGDVAG